MATISAGSAEKVFSIQRFLGLNEAPDGDAKMKFGEASECVNWQITREGCLKRRPGSQTVFDASPLDGRPIRALRVVRDPNDLAGRTFFMAVCGSMVYKIDYGLQTDSEEGGFAVTGIGNVTDGDGPVLIYDFAGLVYIIDGTKFWQYDGYAITEVDGYRPLVAIVIEPNGAYETAEQINKLTGKRRGWLSPDGTSPDFPLPEKGFTTVDYVRDLKTGEDLPPSAYFYDITNGKLVFSGSIPPQGVNSYEVGWTMPGSFRSEVTAMKYSEFYSGSQDNRVFLYGDGSGTALYSGLDYDGQPRGDYFPDLAEVRVGLDNEPITGMIRHYGSLICYKTNSAYSLQFGLTTLADGSVEGSFYVTPINRQIGNIAPGQVQVVASSPVTLHGREAYLWRNASYYNSNLTADERQATRLSDRISGTLPTFTLKYCVCFDDNYHQVYYICDPYQKKALAYFYAADAWSLYTGLDIGCMAQVDGWVLFGTSDGKVMHLSERYITDDSNIIACRWESGSTDFGQDYTRKHSAQLWVALKPEPHTSVTVSVQTDRKETFTEKVLDADRVRNPGTKEPYLKRLKIKAKKFLYYKIILTSEEEAPAPTVVAADVRVRFTGYAK